MSSFQRLGVRKAVGASCVSHPTAAQGGFPPAAAAAAGAFKRTKVLSLEFGCNDANIWPPFSISSTRKTVMLSRYRLYSLVSAQVHSGYSDCTIRQLNIKIRLDYYTLKKTLRRKVIRDAIRHMAHPQAIIAQAACSLARECGTPPLRPAPCLHWRVENWRSI